MWHQYLRDRSARLNSLRDAVGVCKSPMEESREAIRQNTLTSIPSRTRETQTQKKVLVWGSARRSLSLNSNAGKLVKGSSSVLCERRVYLVLQFHSKRSFQLINSRSIVGTSNHL